MDYWAEKILDLLERTHHHRIRIYELKDAMLAEAGLRDSKKLEVRLRMLDQGGYIKISNAVVTRTTKPRPDPVAEALAQLDRRSKGRIGDTYESTNEY